jgi:hypothetical protein
VGDNDVRSTEIMKAGSLSVAQRCRFYLGLPFLRSSFTLPLAFDACKFNEKEHTSNTEARKPDACMEVVVEEK